MNTPSELEKIICVIWNDDELNGLIRAMMLHAMSGACYSYGDDEMANELVFLNQILTYKENECL